MARLTTLKPRVDALRAGPKPAIVERTRGYANQQRRNRLLSANPLCVYCERRGLVAAAVHLDHRVPLWAGGADADHNLDPICLSCHLAKSKREAAERGGNAA